MKNTGFGGSFGENGGKGRYFSRYGGAEGARRWLSCLVKELEGGGIEKG